MFARRQPLLPPTLLRLLWLALVVVSLPFAGAAPTYKKSWLKILPPDPGPYSKGETIVIQVDYRLDPEDAATGETEVVIRPLGPRDAPGTNPLHRPYPGMEPLAAQVATGEGRLTFRFKVGDIFKRNDLNFTAAFQTNGKRWPLVWFYDARLDEPLVKPIRLETPQAFYTLETDRPANLFTYEEPVRLRIAFRRGAVAGERRTLRYRLFDTSGEETAGAVEFATATPGASTEVVVPVEKRGLFALEATVEGWGSRELVFGRIPDVRAITRDGPTPFGATQLQTGEQNVIARRLGLTFTRHLDFYWAKAQPAPDRWELDVWDRILDTNQRHGIAASITITAPPLWAMPDGTLGRNFQPFPFDAEAWRQSIRTLATRWAGKLHGFEWLNEITPGDQTPDPVGTYLAFCRIGSETVREVAPHLKIQLAGGLWPINFRKDVLHAGIASHIDILPVHYSDENGVLDALEDLGTAGEGAGGNVALWDNESAHPVWVPPDMPWREVIRDRTQSEWVLRRWPGELVAGAKRIIYFGGYRSIAAGGWNYLIDGETPRPVAVTLAVQSAKLGLARPLGRIPLGELGIAYLFENEGNPVAVFSTRHTGGEEVALEIGANSVVVTDYQGNETRVPAPDGKLKLKLETLPVFVEGGTLEAWLSHSSLRIGSGRDRARYVRPRGERLVVPVEVKNPYNHPLPVTMALRTPTGWKAPEPVSFTIPPGKQERLPLSLAIPTDAPTGQVTLEAAAEFPSPLPVVHRKIILDVIDPSAIGNLVKNPGFEQAASGGPQRATGWNASGGAHRKAVDAAESRQTPGLGEHLLAISGVAAHWESASQEIKVLPGQSYLYSAWVRTENATAGSNVTLKFHDGSSQILYLNKVFRAPSASPWRYIYARIDTTPETESISLSPTAKGEGSAAFDNVSFTLHEGTPYAAQAIRTSRPLRIDGQLDDWDLDSVPPLPLLADNQLLPLEKEYRWSPENLSGVAWLRWDAAGLYLAVRVHDDSHHAFSDERNLTQGDSLVLAMHPADPALGDDHRAFAYTVSAARPGTGGGEHILYRAPSHSGGLSSGHLARDSSVYKLAVRRDEEKRITTYELFMPWAELGGISAEAGARFGLSLQLNDNDGKEKAAAMMLWGEGLRPAWNPRRFGIVTLINE